MITQFITKFIKIEYQTKDTALIFTTRPENFNFQTGQYVSWTISHPNPDPRGITRSFTLASAETEDELVFLSKFYEPSSTFKVAMRTLSPGQEMQISSARGDFLLPPDTSLPLVFIAGGVGAAPFRAFFQHLKGISHKHPITFFYANQYQDNIPLKSFFDIQPAKIIYTLTRENPENWTGETGYITAKMIEKYISRETLSQAKFYLCGSINLSTAITRELLSLKIKPSQLHRDIFTGYTDSL